MKKNTENIQEIIEKLTLARDAYYNSDSPIITDAEFDSLEKKLEELDPENPYFETVGIAPADGKKIVHPSPMLSMGKAKDMDDIRKWMKRLALPENEKFIIEPKIDGLSAACRYKKGKLVYTASRGDGITGQDITHIAEYVRDIKKKISFTDEEIEIRGELYLPKNTSYENPDSRPLRNICVGLINRKERREDLKHVRFAAYQISEFSGARFESEKIELLKKTGFNTAEYKTVSSPEGIESFYNSYLETYRSNWEYETDGIIISADNENLFDEIDNRWVVSHHHHYAIAFKAPSESKQTSLKDIAWQISRQGNIIPVAVFEPVIIGGAKLERATLNNYQNVLNLKLKRGDTLVVVRANDVIPFIKENLSAETENENNYDRNLIPEKCPGCSSILSEEGVHLKCNNKNCDEQIIEQIIFWVRQSNIENVAEATIRTLYAEKKIRSIRDLYSLAEKDFAELAGFAEKKIKNFIDEVHSSKKINSIELISRLGIPLVQKKALKKIGINTIDDFYNYNDDSYVIGKNIIGWKSHSRNIDFLKNLITVLDIEDTKSSESKGKVCMTGKGPKSRKDLITDIENRGFEFSDTVTSDTEILICEDPEGISSKLEKARKSGIKIMSYSDFFSSY